MGMLKEPHRLTAPDQPCGGLPPLSVRPSRVVKVRVSDDDPIARLLDVVDPNPVPAAPDRCKAPKKASVPPPEAGRSSIRTCKGCAHEFYNAPS
jgi:hypothetical protein